jgi:tripartite ATP-independent transporter DctP family solute receptor
VQGKYKVLLGILLLCVVISSSFLLIDRQVSDTKVLHLGHAVDTGHAMHKSLAFFKERVDELSGGELDIQISPSSQLGAERDLIELMQVGSLAMAQISAGPLESFVPEMQIFSLPYVFDNSDHFWRTINGEIGEELLLSPLKVDLRGLAFFEAGSRSFYTCPKPIESPDDLGGMKIRTMKSQSAVSLMRELGASATPISFGEVYTALQQGVIDGAENSPISYYKTRHYEICKNFTLDEHNTIPGIVLFSEKIWRGLTAQQQDWLTQAMELTVPFQIALWESETQLALESLEAQGVTIIVPDKAPFQEAVQGFKDSFQGTTMGDLLNRIEGTK